jgi:hypothetical protein
MPVKAIEKEKKALGAVSGRCGPSYATKCDYLSTRLPLPDYDPALPKTIMNLHLPRLAAGVLLLCASSASASLTLSLGFIDDSFIVGRTGTFTLSGTHNWGERTSTASGYNYVLPISINDGYYASDFYLELESTSISGTLGSAGSELDPDSLTLVFDSNAGYEHVMRISGSLFDTLAMDVTGTSTVNVSGTFMITYLEGSALGPEDLADDYSGTYVVSTQVVPEPSTYAALAGVAVLGLALVRNRRRE